MAQRIQNPDAPASYGQKAAIGILIVDAALPALTKGEASDMVDKIKKGTQDAIAEQTYDVAYAAQRNLNGRRIAS